MLVHVDFLSRMASESVLHAQNLVFLHILLRRDKRGALLAAAGFIVGRESYAGSSRLLRLSKPDDVADRRAVSIILFLIFAWTSRGAGRPRSDLTARIARCFGIPLLGICVAGAEELSFLCGVEYWRADLHLQGLLFKWEYNNVCRLARER